MSLWNSLVSAVTTANESAHADRLEKEFSDSIDKIFSLDTNMTFEVVNRFLDKKRDILVESKNWSQAGKISVANALRTNARKTFDFNVVEGYALWMTSAWLENGARSNNPKCFRMWKDLDETVSP